MKRVAAITAAVGGVALASYLIVAPRPVPSGPPHPAPARTNLTLRWDYGQGSAPGADFTMTDGTTFEVWHSTNFFNWKLRATVPSNSYVFRNDKPKEFFRVRTRKGNQVSDWATTR